MKSVKLIVTGIFVALGIFCAINYSSCSKDSCKGVTCLNYGTCGGSVCNCKPGTGGSNCETVYRNLYAGKYAGVATYSIIHADTSNTLVFSATNDTTYTNMQLVWTDPGFPVINLPITIKDSLSTGAVFTVTTTKVDTFTYSGSGSVNGTTASLNLTKNHANGPAILVTFTNFVRQ